MRLGIPGVMLTTQGAIPIPQHEAPNPAAEKKYTQADLNRAAVASWNDAIEVVLVHVKNHNGKSMGDMIERTIDEYALRIKP